MYNNYKSDLLILYIFISPTNQWAWQWLFVEVLPASIWTAETDATQSCKQNPHHEEDSDCHSSRTLPWGIRTCRVKTRESDLKIMLCHFVCILEVYLMVVGSLGHNANKAVQERELGTLVLKAVCLWTLWTILTIILMWVVKPAESDTGQSLLCLPTGRFSNPHRGRSKSIKLSVE